MCRILILLLIINVSAQAQIKNIGLKMSDDTNQSSLEPSVAINPKNPENIVIGATPDNIYVTRDGGATWSSRRIKSSFGVSGDPVVIADKKGNFFYFHLSSPESEGSEKRPDRIVCHRSDDEGETWEEESFIGLKANKVPESPRAVSDRKGNIHLTWTQSDEPGSDSLEQKSNIMYSMSSNRGKKWSDPEQLNAVPGDSPDEDISLKDAMPAVTDEGKIYVVWVDGKGLSLDRSFDGGKMWLRNNLKIIDPTGGWYFKVPGLMEYDNIPVLIADRSPTILNKMIYLNWSDQSSGVNDTDIWFSSSHNGGDSWSNKVRVNNDTTGNHQFLSWMTQDYTTGFIYVVFYDRRNYDDLQTDVYLAYSKNGGRTFNNIKISEAPFTPGEDQSLGEYINIDAQDGKIVPVWTRVEDGVTRIVTTVLNQKELDEMANSK